MEVVPLSDHVGQEETKSLGQILSAEAGLVCLTPNRVFALKKLPFDLFGFTALDISPLSLICSELTSDIVAVKEIMFPIRIVPEYFHPQMFFARWDQIGLCQNTCQSQ